MKERFLLVHSHRFGVTPFFVVSKFDILMEEMDKGSDSVLLSNIGIDFEPEKGESLEIISLSLTEPNFVEV